MESLYKILHEKELDKKKPSRHHDFLVQIQLKKYVIHDVKTAQERERERERERE